MIDIENYVITSIIAAYTAASKTVKVVSGYYANLPTLPCVQVIQTSNTTYQRSLDNSLTEHHASVTFQIDVYTDKKAKSKSEAKELFAIADSAMQQMKFTRTSYAVDVVLDQTMSRVTGVYRAIVREPIKIDGDIVYQIYRP